MENTQIILIIAGIVVVAIIGIGWSMSCPSCARWFARKDLDTEIIDEKIGYEIHEQEIVTRDSEGNVISTRTEQEQRRVKTTWYFQFHVCTYCQHKWKVEHESSTHDFYE